ncbi:peptide chain release factor 2 [Candidatus Riesia sp. GBBU]|nr:peptide chain release factor 2 [Candidatus Riesia sp. GBBU]
MLKERSKISLELKKIDLIKEKINEISDLLYLSIEFDEMNSMETEINSMIEKVEKKISYFETLQLFSKKNDKKNCYLDLQSGSGGADSKNWTKVLMRMYIRWAESMRFNTEIIKVFEDDNFGIKSSTIRIVGKYAYGWMRTETGIHRLVRKSPFDVGNRRHTSFSSVFFYPEKHDEININLKLEDIRVDVYRSSGAGGQHVNKTESAVRVTHVPTGIISQCQETRSQHKNKEKALKQLKKKLYIFEKTKRNFNKKNFIKSKSSISWSNQIRSYILDDSRIKDLRTGIETRNIQSVLDGDLRKFVIASLKSGL